MHMAHMFGLIFIFIFLVVFLLASSSDSFMAWYDPLLCVDSVDWCPSTHFLVYSFGVVLHPESGNIPQNFRVAHRTLQVQ